MKNLKFLQKLFFLLVMGFSLSTLSAFSEAPATMPSCDIEIHGTYIPDEGAEMTLDGHGYVDLGLPSKKLWATCNYGAGSVEDYGAYLDWSDADVVKTEWGSNWKTPSYSDVKELVTKCTWTEETINGVKGYKATGPNESTIFFPSAGWGKVTFIPSYGEYEHVDQVGNLVCYWTETLNQDIEIFAYTLYANGSSIEYNMTFTTESMRLPVRPVSTITSDDLDISTNQYTITYIIDGEVFVTETFKSGESIVLPNVPEKEGYTFSGWNEVPATMPSCDIEIHGTYIAEMTLDGHGYVDLGLPSKKLWATCNYGASSVEDDGAHLYWSDTDVVKTEWGSNWKTPSYDDVRELVLKCTWKEERINGIFKGYKVTGPNGNTMYLPKLLYEFRFWTDTVYEIFGNHMAYVLCRQNDTVDYQISYNTEFVQAHIRPVSTITSDDLASGIETPLVDNHSLVNVYSLQGVMIKSQVPVSTLEEELSSGIYIINGKKFMVK